MERIDPLEVLSKSINLINILPEDYEVRVFTRDGPEGTYYISKKGNTYSITSEDGFLLENQKNPTNFFKDMVIEEIYLAYVQRNGVNNGSVLLYICEPGNCYKEYWERQKIAAEITGNPQTLKEHGTFNELDDTITDRKSLGKIRSEDQTEYPGVWDFGKIKSEINYLRSF